MSAVLWHVDSAWDTQREQSRLIRRRCIRGTSRHDSVDHRRCECSSLVVHVGLGASRGLGLRSGDFGPLVLLQGFLMRFALGAFIEMLDPSRGQLIPFLLAKIPRSVGNIDSVAGYLSILLDHRRNVATAPVPMASAIVVLRIRAWLVLREDLGNLRTEIRDRSIEVLRVVGTTDRNARG